MKTEKGIEWFKNQIVPFLEDEGYEISYRFFEQGDFGSLGQFELLSEEFGATVDFWGLGWTGVFIVDYKKEEVILNILTEPDESEEKDRALETLISILGGC